MTVRGSFPARDQHDRGRVRGAGKQLRDREAVQTWELDVEQDDLRAKLRGCGDRRVAVGRTADDGEALGLQQRRRRFAEVGVVVDDQNARAHVLIVADAGAERIVASRNREHESLEPASSEVCGQLRFRAARGPLASAAELNRKGANVNPLIKRLALALLVASVAAVSANAAGAAGDRHSAKVPLAGPWYTPKELKALNAYSEASFTQKKALLAGSDAAPTTADGGTITLAGPRYRPQELKALIAYSKASFAQKKALLAGTETSTISVGDKFHWSDAGIGAGVALGCVFVAGAAAAVLARSRTERRRPRHT